VDDIAKILAGISDTQTAGLSGGSDAVKSSPMSSSSTTPASASAVSATSTQAQTPSHHEEDSLDKILADLETQLKAQQNEKKHVSGLVEAAPTSSMNSSHTSPLPAVQNHKELVVEEKHELVKKEEVLEKAVTTPTSTSTSTSTPTSTSVSSKSASTEASTPSVAEHAFTLGSGIAAAQKKVVPEVVGLTSSLGFASMKKDAAVPTPPSMPGIADIKVGGNGQKPKKRGHLGAILGIALLVFTLVGTGVGITLNLMPGGVFDPRRYAADNMCNVNPGSCTTDQDWINGWYSARTEENKDATPTQTEYTNRDNAVVEVIRNAGDSNAVNYSEQSAARGDNVPVTGVNTNQASAAEAARVTATSFADRSKEDAKNLQALADKAKASGDMKTYDKLMKGVTEAQAQAKAMEGIGTATKTNEQIKALMDAAKAQAAAAASGAKPGETSGGSVYNHAAFANQTLDNMCNNSSYKKCDNYQDWIDGWVAARKQENFGKTATSPEYTDSAKDLDGDPSNGIQIGLITRDASGRLVVNEMVTLDVPAGTTADQIKNMTSHLSVKAGTKVAIYQDATGKVTILKPTNLSSYDPTKDPYNGYDAAKCNALPGCSGGACWCGEQSSGSNGFCGAASIGTKTCNTQIIERGGIVIYGGYAEVVGSACGGANTVDRSGVQVSICPVDSKYSECAPYLNGQYKCYPKTQETGMNNPCSGFSQSKDGIAVCPANSIYSDCFQVNGTTWTCNKRVQTVSTNSFKVNTSTQCLTAGSDAVVAGYYCQGVSEVNRSTGCNDSSNTVISPKSGGVCVNDVVAAVTASNKSICGVVQIDVDNPKTGEHYSMNVYSQAGCAGTPPASNPPRQFNGCTTNCGGGDTPTPPPSTPPSSPPPGSPVCVDITSSISSPQLGQAPAFTCLPAATATRYEFRYRIGTGAYSTLAPTSTSSNVSTPLTVNASGNYLIQCRPCNANGCANWDNL